MSLINVNNLTFYYEGSYDNIFENVSFQIDTDWKLGFIARNGKGKTTFLKLLMGEYEYKGSISTSVVFDYFPFKIKDKSRNTIDIIEEIYPDYEFWKICREINLLEVDMETRKILMEYLKIKKDLSWCLMTEILWMDASIMFW